MVGLNGIKMKNRFGVASGALGYGNGWSHQKPLIKFGLIDPSVFGFVVTKTLLLEKEMGNYDIDPVELAEMSYFSGLCRILCHIYCPNSPERRVLRRIPNGWLNNLRWSSVGIDYWKDEIYPTLDKNIAIVPSIGGFYPEEYLQLIEKLNPLDILAIELNVSCPNIKKSDELKRSWSCLFHDAKRFSRHSLILKIGASEEDIRLAQTAAAIGFNAISAINAVPGAIVTKEGIFRGGQSGPRIKETALEWLLRLKEALRIPKTPIIGGGGITPSLFTYLRDCRDFLQVVDAVSFGSVFLSLTRFWLPTWIAKNYGANGVK